MAPDDVVVKAQTLMDRYAAPSEHGPMWVFVTAYVLRTISTTAIGEEARAICNWANDNKASVCLMVQYGDTGAASSLGCPRGAAITKPHPRTKSSV